MTLPHQDRDPNRIARAAWLRALELTAPIRRNAAPIFPVLVDELASKFGPSTAILCDAEQWSYAALAQRMNRYARWALAQGIGGDDVVCLILPNSPDYLAAWLGLTRIGAVVALVNVNLAGDALARAVGMVAPTHVIADARYQTVVMEMLPRLSSPVRCWGHGESGQDVSSVDREIAAMSGDRLSDGECPEPALGDQALYLYTSGTAGFPKAAKVSHRRLMEWSHWFAGMIGTRPDDRLYDCLPMYHGIGGIAAIGASLVAGGSVVLAPRFSANRFWADVTQWDCTLFQYIGELCRYLLNAPSQPDENRHRIRLCCGNGLSAEVWNEFQSRFRIPRILEFYAATEGTVSLYNCEGKAGAIGRVPAFLAHRSPVDLIKLDPETGQPVRDDDGRCVRCSANEPGEAIGRMETHGSGGGGRFEGYTDQAASGARLLRDVFADGDAWFRTGDLMRRDEGGFFYFVDRIGDTFRWKGENVSTTEVAAAISTCRGVLDAAVYGVRVPGTDGRAGMAAIVVDANFDLAILWQDLARRLPDYARPLFLRVSPGLETTATLRPRKQDLAGEGFDPAATPEPLYFNDRSQRKYLPIDATLYRRIVAGELRL